MKTIRFGKFEKWTSSTEQQADARLAWQIPPINLNLPYELLDWTLPAAAPTAPDPPAPAFPHFSPEERSLWQMIGYEPDAGWDPDGIPAFTTSYLNLEKLVGEFPDNGQPSEVNRRRMWSTRLIRCDACGGHTAAHWVDRWELVAGYYCDDCHQDYQINSYLLNELNRKPHDAIISQSHAYLTDNPDFQGFNLFQPGRIAYLGASMGMGKTTAIFEQLPRHSPGKAGIVLVPRISLAQALATRYRYEYGHNAVGVFHEGSGHANRFIGTHGAIGCLSALPAIVRQAHEQSIDNLFIAIDELDFAYELKRLRPEYAPMIFRTLSQAVDRHGIAVAGQTETLLSLESFVREVGRSEQDITAFYAHASPAPGEVHLVEYPQVERCTHTVRLHGLITAIKKHLSAGKRIYAFFSDRRDVRTVEAIFADYQPVAYTAYSKGERRAKALLENQRLTDSQLLLATSAAAVGISVIDDNAVTLICVNQRFGQRPWREIVQESLRNRARADVEIHYSDTPVALPIKPSEAEATSLYHQSLKQFHDEHPHAIEHTARNFALDTLADSQPVDYLRHHLERIAGMKITEHKGVHADTESLQSLKEIATAAKTQEREEVQHRATVFFNRNEILVESEIRRRSVSGSLDRLSHLAHERLNAYVQLVGWDGESEMELAPAQRELVTTLINDGADVDTLIKRRRGWIATRFPDPYAQIFANEKASALDADIEADALTDDRFRGQVLGKLIDGLKGRVFTQDELSFQLITILACPQPNVKHTPLSLIQKGALGTAAYRQARFTGKTTPTATVKWVRDFISEWYPARIKKEYGNDAYALTPADPAAISIFRVWAKHRYGITLDTDNSTDPPVLPGEQMKQQAQQLREQGKTIREIASETGLSKSKVARQTEGKKETAQDRIRKVLADGKPRQAKDIIAKANVSLRIFNLEVKKLDNVNRIRRGVYQRTN